MIIAYHGFLILADNAALYSAYAYSADIIIVVDRGNEQLKRSVFVALGRGDIIKYRIEKRLQVFARLIGREGSRARSARAPEHRSVELFIGSIQLEQKLQYLIAYLVETSIGAVYLVYHNDDGMTEFKRTLKHKARLRHGSLCRVNEKNNAVYHFQYAFNLAAEIRVSGCVDYVYLHAVIVNGCVLCEYCDAAFALQSVGVHNALLCRLIFSVNAALTEHFIYERCLAVVDMSNYRHISKVISYHGFYPAFILDFHDFHKWLL